MRKNLDLNSGKVTECLQNTKGGKEGIIQTRISGNVVQLEVQLASIDEFSAVHDGCRNFPIPHFASQISLIPTNSLNVLCQRTSFLK